MRKLIAPVHALTERHEDFFFARTLATDDVSHIADTEADAIAGLEALLAAVLEESPNAFEKPRENTIVRHVRLSLPGFALGRSFELKLQLFAVCLRRDDDDMWDVLFPQIARSISIKSLDELESIAGEYLRSWFPYEERVSMLIGLTKPLVDHTEDGEDPRIKLHTLKIRYRTKTDSQVALTNDAAPPILSQVGEPIHTRMRRRDAPRAYRRTHEVDSLLNQLAETADRSVLLVGESGVGKTAIMYEAVHRITHDRAPASLKDSQVWEISGGRLMAGMMYLGEWQERVIQVIAEAKENGVILFAENLIELLETSGTEKFAQGIPGLLLPHILSGDLVLVTEVRPEQLSRAEQTHPSFLRALRPLPIEPMAAAETNAVLERLSFRLARQYQTTLPEATRQQILHLCGRFRGASVLPGPAVELADRMARTNAVEGVDVELTSDHALTAFASLTGLPAELLDRSQTFDPNKVREHFTKAIFSQPEAVESVVNLVTTIRAGLNAPTRPLGAFLFLGPTGVGKTQTALTLAEYLFSDRDRLVRFDMSEYQDSWSAGRLVGRYKGEQGDLVRKIREQPFQIVLLDEIEKAHPTVFDYLLQALGEGRLTDGLGRTVYLTSAVIIMTSNLGAGGPSSLGFASGGADADRKAEVSHYFGAVEKYFRPEFIGRIDQIIPFRSLGRPTAERLVLRALEQAFGREGLERRNIKCTADPEVVSFLIDVGFNEKYGARPLRRAVENYVMVPLAEFLNRFPELQKASISLRMKDALPVVELL